MKKLVCLTLFMSAFAGLLKAEGEKKNLVRGLLYLYPQVGLSFNQPTNVTPETKNGYIMGLGIRIGSKVNFLTGAYFQSNAFSGQIDPNAPNGAENQEVRANYLLVPAALGYHLVNFGMFKVKASLGAAYYHLLGSDYQKPNSLQEIEFTGGLWCARGGVGIEVWKIAVDCNYDLGFTKTFSNVVESRNRQLHVTLGFRF